jgi:hypothetical protein
MMDTKFITKAKAYLRSRGRSLSDLAEDHLKFLTSRRKEINLELTPRVRSLLGSIPAAKDLEYKRVLGKELQKKI